MSEVIFNVDNKNVSGMITQIVQMINKGLFIGPVEVVLRRAARSLSQNKKLWPMLSDIQKQVDWYGDNLDTDDWKVMFMASLHKQRSVPGIDGGFVGLSKRSSRLNKEEFSQLIEVIYAFGSERNVCLVRAITTNLFKIQRGSVMINSYKQKNIILKGIQNSIKSADIKNLTITQLSILIFIMRRKEVTQAQISKSLELSRPTVCRITQLLSNQNNTRYREKNLGLITFKNSSSIDRRVKDIILTDKGEALINRFVYLFSDKQVNWYDETLDSEDWKTMFMSSLHKQRAVPGLDGGFVGLSKRSSLLDKEGSRN